MNTLNKDYSLHLLGTSDEMINIEKESARFIAMCYREQNATDMSEVRYKIWKKRTGNKKASSAPRLKSLLPMKEAFEQHVKCAHYQACLLKNALEQNPPSLDATMFGWQRNDASKTLEPVMLAECLHEILELISCGCKSEDVAEFKTSYHVQRFAVVNILMLLCAVINGPKQIQI
ncbi:MAG: hypothetical protein GY707_16680 [Desulfobacteraceae bacterium]|nr:hypothetical protein [Desulfobacteraceae bacterium]